MGNHLTGITEYLWRQSWQLAVLIAAVAVVCWMLRSRSAHIRYLLWLIVIAKCLVPPVLTVPLAILPAQQRVEPPARLPVAQPLVTSEVREPSSHRSMTMPALSLERDTSSPKTSSFSMLSGRQVLGTVWIMGIAIFGCVAVVKVVRSNLRLRRQRRSLPDDLQVSVGEILSGFGMKLRPKVWLLNGVGQPFVWGLFRGDIYLPTDYLRIDNAAHRRNILGHEVCHILRLDAAVNLLQVLAQALFWFHPLVWWANQKIRMEREKCCDEMAVAHLGTRAKEYSAAIVKALISEHETARPVPSLAVAGSAKDIEERIKTMLRPGKKFYKRPTLMAATFALLLAVCAVPTTMVLTVRAASQPPTDAAGAERVFGNPTNLGPTVNSFTDDYDPSISADGLELYFNSARPGGLGQTDLWVATRKTRTDPWSEPMNLGPTVNSPAGDKAPCISANGLSLYLSSDRSGGYGHLDLWVTTRQTRTAPWGEPINLGPTVNSMADEHSPSISTDGLTLYFADKHFQRSGGYGGGDIWVTTRNTKHDPWGTPVNLGPIVNSSAWDQAPSISDDGLTLYFDSEVGGGSNIWVTTRKTTSDPWGTPIKLSPVVNADWEANPDISRDGSTLYFVSTRPGGVGGVDIWQATLGKSTPQSKAAELAASLHEAVEAGNIQQVRLLLEKGADIDAKVNGMTALHCAARDGFKEIVEVLLAKGADVNAGGYGAESKTAADFAMHNNHSEIVALLFSKGADISALHVALQRGDRAKAKDLIENGADVKKRSPFGITALHLAAERGFTDVAGLLIAEGADVNARMNWTWTPLHTAASKGDKDMVELLVAKGASVNIKTPNGETPLDVAGSRAVVEILAAEHPAAATLQGAAVLGDLAKVKTLLEQGASVNAVHECGQCHVGPVAKTLLEQGADVNTRYGFRQTALHYAAGAGFKEVVEVLVANGADVNAVEGYGSTAAECALDNGHIKIVEFLIAKGATDISPLFLAIHKRDLAQVRDLIAKGADVNRRTQYGTSPLHLAAKAGLRDIAALLIDKGANVNARDPWAWTPLHAAAKDGHKDVAELLIAKGAQVNARGPLGRTPLWYAQEKAHSSVVNLLRQHGAK